MNLAYLYTMIKSRVKHQTRGPIAIFGKRNASRQASHKYFWINQKTDRLEGQADISFYLGGAGAKFKYEVWA